MKSIAFNNLSVSEVRSLTLLDDPVVRAILKSKLRRTELEVDLVTIKQSWQAISTRARNILKVILVEPGDDHLPEAFIRLLAVEFPYREAKA